jgi:hypothetical protein
VPSSKSQNTTRGAVLPVTTGETFSTSDTTLDLTGPRSTGRAFENLRLREDLGLEFHTFAPSTSPWVTRIVRGQPWDVVSLTQ